MSQLLLSYEQKKLNFLNKQCFCRNSVRCQKLQQVFEEQSFCLDAGPQLFSTCLLPCRYHAVEVSPEIRCSGVSSHCCCYGNHAAGSKPI